MMLKLFPAGEEAGHAQKKGAIWYSMLLTDEVPIFWSIPWLKI